MFTVACSRCFGSGKFDRGTCFRCQGLGVTQSARKPAQTFEVSAVFSDGVRRILKSTVAANADAATQKVAAMRDWFGFDMTTVKAK